MAKQTVNPGRINNLEMMNQYKQMSMASSMLKIGKSKRKYEIHLSSKSKKLVGTLAKEMKKQMAGQLGEKHTEGIKLFLDYLELECAVIKKPKVKMTKEEKTKAKKSTKVKANTPEILKVSFEELDFLKTSVSSSVTEMNKMTFKWYSLLKKLSLRLSRKQIHILLKEIKK
ncbi:MAG: hypothetical protein NTX05_09115 [Fusobacteria bacterium]|nr:hypothetical protein [Fusobacteriota bacterium]